MKTLKLLLIILLFISPCFSQTTGGAGHANVWNLNSGLVFTTYSRHHDLQIGSAVLGPNAPTATTVGTARGDGASNMAIEIHWYPTSGDAIANTEKVKFDVHYRSVAAGEAIDNGTLVTATTTFTGGASETDKEYYVTEVTIVYTGGNQPLTVGDELIIQLDRDVTGEAGGGGSYSGMAIIIKVGLEYTAIKTGTH
jgi:hypothetical protein